MLLWSYHSNTIFSLFWKWKTFNHSLHHPFQKGKGKADFFSMSQDQRRRRIIAHLEERKLKPLIQVPYKTESILHVLFLCSKVYQPTTRSVPRFEISFLLNLLIIYNAYILLRNDEQEHIESRLPPLFFVKSDHCKNVWMMITWMNEKAIRKRIYQKWKIVVVNSGGEQ